ncbi:filamentous hemagglutinin N-terminal domain-containing protein [Candidatus Albibeggiatoa sp. nov. BB20]|uniref:two-partner secretion domain-containing protein n=1 Tax=Candidatus Albibeggiatoa sp. nov. BB20 TaxID=3162723 RepID=UPI0033653423
MRLILAILLLLPIMGNTEIVLHHTGKPMTLNAGLDYEIRQEFGQTVGSNLFHTFDRFNLNQGEAAHFSGADSIQNIVARVIGGEPSFIDGTLKSTIPNADLYFLNPYGIMLGVNARLDLQGGLHLSTADYVRLGDEGEFHARFPERNILTTASISSFGFLTDSPAPIDIQGNEINQQLGEKYDANYTQAPLQLKENKDFSLIGGNIKISGHYYYKSAENRKNAIKTPIATMFFPKGEVTMIGVHSSGEVFLDDIDELLDTSELANITLSNIKIKNLGGGFSIYGSNVVLTNTSLFPWIDKEAQALDTNIFAQADLLFKDVIINSNTYGTNDAGSISLESEGNIALQNVEFFSRAKETSQGHAGNIKINGYQNILLEDSKTISSSTWNNKQAGNIKVTAYSGDITIKNSKLFSNANSTELNAGDAGSIKVTGINIALDKSTIFSLSEGKANAGQVDIISYSDLALNDTKIYSDSKAKEGGNTGKISVISGDVLSLKDSNIYSSIQGQDIDITSSGDGAVSLNELDKKANTGLILIGSRNHDIHLDHTEIFSETKGKSSAGNVEIITGIGNITLDSSNIYSDTTSDGHAGMVTMQTKNNAILNHSSIYSNTTGNGDAGVVAVDAGNDVILDSSTIYSNTTKGQASGILIEGKRDVILINQSNVYANTAQEEIKGEDSAIIINGVRNFILENSTISTNTSGKNNAGIMLLASQQNIILNNAMITSDTTAEGQAGFIFFDKSFSSFERNLSDINQYDTTKDAITTIQNINTTTNVTLKDSTISTKTSSQGEGGTMFLFAKNLELDNSNITSGSESIFPSSGDAGTIVIGANELSLFNNSKITTEAKNSGGGAISLAIGTQLYLPQDTKITTSVKSGVKNGGDIFIANPTFSVLNKGEIHADARGGNGGNIGITTTGYFVSDNDLVTASSKFGLDGYIQIDTLGSLNSEALENLPTEMTDTDLELQPSCLNLGSSSFTLISHPGISTRAHDWQPAH